MKPQIIASTRDMPRDRWLSLRRQGIGSSDAAAVAGLNPYQSPLDVYLDKTGQLVNDEDNERMKRGRQLEPIIAQMFAEETGLKVRRKNQLLACAKPGLHFAQANLDFTVQGEDAILEVKNVGERMADLWEENGVPEMYLIQVHHQLLVTGAAYAYICALIGGNKLRYSRVDRDENILAQLTEIEARFWGWVKEGTPPPVDGGRATKKALAALYPEETGGSVELDEAFATALVNRIEQEKAYEKAAREQRELCENQLKAMLGINTFGLINGVPRVKWSTVKRDGYYVKPTEYRQLRILNPKEELTDGKR